MRGASVEERLPPAGPVEPPPPPDVLADRILGGWLGCHLGAEVAAGGPRNGAGPARGGPPGGTPPARWTATTGSGPRTGPAREPEGAPGDRRDPRADPRADRRDPADRRDFRELRDFRGLRGGHPRDAVAHAVLTLRVLERYGPGFTRAQMETVWRPGRPSPDPAETGRPPRSAPPASATGRGAPVPGDEAMARAGLYGCVSPGDARRAARLARRDACLSHTGDGVDAAMWTAALTAVSFTAPGTIAAVALSLRHIPVGCALSVALRGLLVAHARGHTWADAAVSVRTRFASAAPRDAVAGACLAAAGLLWGGEDPARTVALTVRGGRDARIAAAVAGMAAGIVTGAAAFPGAPPEWAPEEPGAETYRRHVSALAERTYAVTREHLA